MLQPRKMPKSQISDKLEIKKSNTEEEWQQIKVPAGSMYFSPPNSIKKIATNHFKLVVGNIDITWESLTENVLV